MTVTAIGNDGDVITSVTSAQQVDLADNPLFLRAGIITKDLYGKTESLNLDQLVAGFRT